MQGIRKQQETIRQFGTLSGGHGGLTAPIGMAAEINMSRRKFAKRLGRAADSFAIARRLRGKRWPMQPLLSIRQIESQHPHSVARERLRDCFDQRRLAI